MWTRAELKERGKAAMQRNYWNAVLAALILGICVGGGGGSVGNAGRSASSSSDAFGDLSPEIVMIIVIALLVAIIIGTALKIFVFNPLSVSCYRFFVKNDHENANLNELGYGFKNNYMNVVKIMFLKDLYISLWSLLFIIPGIIKSYEYYMIPYLLADDSSLTSTEIFEMTKDMMTGNKMDTFVLNLSFFGWGLLALLTCGILSVFYVSPYANGTYAALYNTLKDGITPDNTMNDSYSDSVYQGATY